MRVGLIALGIIFLVVGGLLYYYPSQSFSTQTDSSTTGATNARTSSAAFNVSVEWSYALMIIGGLFLLFGLAIPGSSRPVKIIPGPVRYVRGPRGPRGTRGRTMRTVRTVRSYRPRRRRRTLARGTSVTTTTTRTRR